VEARWSQWWLETGDDAEMVVQVQVVTVRDIDLVAAMAAILLCRCSGGWWSMAATFMI